MFFPRHPSEVFRSLDPDKLKLCVVRVCQGDRWRGLEEEEEEKEENEEWEEREDWTVKEPQELWMGGYLGWQDTLRFEALASNPDSQTLVYIQHVDV